MLVDGEHKKAVKAAVARMTVRGDTALEYVAAAVADAIQELSLQAGDLSSPKPILDYAWGVQARGEMASNRKWANYPRPVQALAATIVRRADRVLDTVLR